ncbi:hypothetical protein DICA3_C18118 [Diutina catenulata]
MMTPREFQAPRNMNTPTHTTFRHDLRSPGQPNSPFTSSNNTPAAPSVVSSPITRQVEELQELLGVNEQLINKNIRGLETLSHKWDGTHGSAIDSTQSNLNQIQEELALVLQRLDVRCSAVNPRRKHSSRLGLHCETSSTPHTSFGGVTSASYAHPVTDWSPTFNVERNKTLNNTYAALTAGEEDTCDFDSQPSMIQLHQPMHRLMEAYGNSKCMHTPIRLRIDGVVSSFGDLISTIPIDHENNEMLAELMANVEDLIGAFTDDCVN